MWTRRGLFGLLGGAVVALAGKWPQAREVLPQGGLLMPASDALLQRSERAWDVLLVGPGLRTHTVHTFWLAPFYEEALEYPVPTGSDGPSFGQRRWRLQSADATTRRAMAVFEAERVHGLNV